MFSTGEKFLVFFTVGKTTKCDLKATLRLRNQQAERENAAFLLL